MVDFAEHRKALLCNDAASIADYSSAMDQATKAVAAWLQNEKCTQAVALKSSAVRLHLILLKKVWVYKSHLNVWLSFF